MSTTNNNLIGHNNSYVSVSDNEDRSQLDPPESFDVQQGLKILAGVDQCGEERHAYVRYTICIDWYHLKRV